MLSYNYKTRRTFVLVQFAYLCTVKKLPGFLNFLLSCLSPIYETYCMDHYADGRCDQGCNNEECGWDGLDCARTLPEDLADGVLVIVVLLPPEELLRTGAAFLQKLSTILRTSLRFRLDHNGDAMIKPYTRREERLKRELQPHTEVIGWVV